MEFIKTGNVIFFESEGDFCDNARALFDYMLTNGYSNKYKLVWNVKNPVCYKKYFSKNVIFVSRTQKNIVSLLKFIYYKNSAKIFFFTHPYWLLKRKKGQTVVNLWHGFGYKVAKSDKNTFDYAISIGAFHSKLLTKTFSCDIEHILPLGFPRNDILMGNNHKDIHDLFDLNKDSKIILWMPTFRKAINKNMSDDVIFNETGLPVINTVADLKLLDSILSKNNCILILKLHHLQDDSAIKILNSKNIVMLTDNDLNRKEIQLYEFIKESDALISDYSSVAIDYLLLNKQIGFTLDDFLQYSDKRGFEFENPKEFMPGEHIYTVEDMERYILNIAKGNDEFTIKREEIKEKLFQLDAKSSSQKIVEYFKL
jgi:CDP-glycerol glycerophosphotransferase (TagB/SpsB family)